MSRFGRNSSAVATYTILAVAQRGVSFLILPFITHAISPADYGAASLLASGAMLLVTLLATPLSQLVTRAAARNDEDAPALLRLMGLYCYRIMPLVGAIGAALVAAFVPSILGVPGYIWAIELVAVGFQPSATAYAIWAAQGRNQLGRFAAITITSVLTTVVSKLILVVAMHKGLLGWVLSDLVTAIAAAFVGMVLVRLPHAHVTRKHLRDVLNFCLPLVPHQVSFWVLTFLSRPAMAAVAPLEEVGVFSFALNLAQLAGLILLEGNRGLLMRYATEKFPAPSDEMVGIVKWQLTASLVVPTLVGCGVALLGSRLFPESYWPAFSIVGILLVGQMATGLYAIPMNFLTQTAGITRFSAIASGGGAIILFTGILLFAPRHGATAVAIATVAANFAMAGVALGLVLAHRLDIAWRSWAPTWPAVALGVGALGLTIAALNLPADSPQIWKFVLATLAVDGLAVAFMGTKGPKVSLRSSTA